MAPADRRRSGKPELLHASFAASPLCRQRHEPGPRAEGAGGDEHPFSDHNADCIGARTVFLWRGEAVAHLVGLVAAEPDDRQAAPPSALAVFASFASWTRTDRFAEC